MKTKKFSWEDYAAQKAKIEEEDEIPKTLSDAIRMHSHWIVFWLILIFSMITFSITAMYMWPTY